MIPVGPAMYTGGQEGEGRALGFSGDLGHTRVQACAEAGQGELTYWQGPRDKSHPEGSSWLHKFHDGQFLKVRNCGSGQKDEIKSI